jgi:hypothetical protein
MTEAEAITGMVISICHAGFDEIGNPLFLTLYDRKGAPVWLAPKTMGPVQIVAYLRRFFGDDVAEACAGFPILQVH